MIDRMETGVTKMAYSIHMVTNEKPEGFLVGPKGKHAKPYVYPTKADACMAIAHIKDGMRIAGYDVDFGLVYDVVAV